MPENYIAAEAKGVLDNLDEHSRKIIDTYINMRIEQHRKTAQKKFDLFGTISGPAAGAAVLAIVLGLSTIGVKACNNDSKLIAERDKTQLAIQRCETQKAKITEEYNGHGVEFNKQIDGLMEENNKLKDLCIETILKR